MSRKQRSLGKCKKKMAPERDIGVKNKYPCTSLFLTLSLLNMLYVLLRESVKKWFLNVYFLAPMSHFFAIFF